MDKKEAKLKFVRDAFWNRFEATGNIYDYGRYKGAEQLLNEHQASKMSQQELE